MNRSLVFLVAGLAFAQEDRPYRISGGFKIGAPVNRPATSRFVTGTILTESRWTGGPTAEFSLPSRFAIGFEALYRNRQEDFGGIANLATGFRPPLWLKYRFRVGPARPFLTAGCQWSREH